MTERLDLRAVSELLESCATHGELTAVVPCDNLRALLAHCRALRVALQEGLEHMHPMTCASMDGYEDSGKPCDCWHSRAAAVLAAAGDAAGAAPEETHP